MRLILVLFSFAYRFALRFPSIHISLTSPEVVDCTVCPVLCRMNDDSLIKKAYAIATITCIGMTEQA